VFVEAIKLSSQNRMS